MTIEGMRAKINGHGTKVVTAIPLTAIVVWLAIMCYHVLQTKDAVAEICPKVETTILKQERLEATVVTRLEDIVRRLDRMERAADRRNENP